MGLQIEVAFGLDSAILVTMRWWWQFSNIGATNNWWRFRRSMPDHNRTPISDIICQIDHQHHKKCHQHQLYSISLDIGNFNLNVFLAFPWVPEILTAIGFSKSRKIAIHELFRSIKNVAEVFNVYQTLFPNFSSI